MGKIDCVFCGNNAPRAKEHVFPVWMLTALDAAHEVIPFQHRGATGAVVSERHHTLDTFRFGHVCAGCNNGFLSRLEVFAKHAFAGLFGGRRSLGPVDCYGLALWTLKTAVMLNAASNYRRIIPDLHARAVREMTPPAGLFVHLAFRTERQKVSWHQCQQLFFAGSEDAVRIAAEGFGSEGFNVVLGFADVLIRAVYLPSPRFAVGPASPRAGRQALIWPRRSTVKIRKRHPYTRVAELVDDTLAYEVR